MRIELKSQSSPERVAPVRATVPRGGRSPGGHSRPGGLLLRVGVPALGLFLAGFLAGLPGSARAGAPEWHAFASFIIPGLGQTIQGDYVTGGVHFGSTLVMARQYTILTERDDFIEPEDRVDEDRKVILTNRTTFTADLYATGLINLQFYSAYAAYRDQRNIESNAGYETPAPEESAADLALAPFRWEHLSRPTVWLPLLIPLYAVLTPASDEQFLFEPDDSISRDEMAAWFFVQHEMVAVGEESFFRGILNNGLSSSLGPGWGLGTSSLLFGAAHIGAPDGNTPVFATLFGLYVGWLQQENEYRIGQGIAIHYWWNVLVSLSMLAERDNPGQMNLFMYQSRF